MKKVSINTEKLIADKIINVKDISKIIFHNSGSDTVTILEVFTIPANTTFELSAGTNHETFDFATISIAFGTNVAPNLEVIKFQYHD